MKRILLLIACVLLISVSAGCGGESDPPETDVDPAESENISVAETEPASPTEPDYSDIYARFANIIPDAEITVSKQSSRVSVRINTALGSDTAPDGWDATVEAFGLALETANPLAADYDASTVSAEIYGADETILSSGYNGAVKYNLFSQSVADSARNPPTISKFEYDQISVGMSLSEVTDIIGGSGTAQNQIGEAGGYGSLITTYRWLGEKDGSYADILFENYKVYSKVQIFLE